VGTAKAELRRPKPARPCRVYVVTKVTTHKDYSSRRRSRDIAFRVGFSLSKTRKYSGRLFLVVGELFELAVPIELANDRGILTPVRLHFDHEFQKDFGAEYGF
jgi:hypothetical protein